MHAARLLKNLIAFLLLMMPLSIVAQEYQHYDNHHDDSHHTPEQHTEGEKADEENFEDFDPFHISKDTLSKLKAVIISAEVDGVDGPNTKAFRERMQTTSDYLKSSGVHVYEFFCPNDDWMKIREKAEGAHILIYSGHGVFDGSRPPSWVGGFSLTNSFVTSKQIQEQLHLAPNAVVIFNQACFTAGSAGGDVGDIGLPEAHRRVAIYSHPFIDLGVACYYANNFTDSAIEFLDRLFSRKNVKEIYEETASSWSEIIERKPYDFNKQYSMGISRYGGDKYCVAYVGKPGFKLKDWFK